MGRIEHSSYCIVLYVCTYCIIILLVYHYHYFIQYLSPQLSLFEILGLKVSNLDVFQVTSRCAIQKPSTCVSCTKSMTS